MPSVEIAKEIGIGIENESETKIKVMKQALHNFEEDCQKAYRNFDIYSKKPLVVGRYEDYSKAALEAGDYSIFVHNNVVYIQCPNSSVHESGSREINIDISTSLSFIPGNPFYNLGSTTFKVFNYHGCCADFGKEPDFALGFRKNCNKIEYPVIVGEIGVSHENQHQLFLEAMTYLNGFTDIQYCVTVDISLKEEFFNARIIVCERVLESAHLDSEDDQKNFMKRKKAIKRRQGALPLDGDEVCQDIADESCNINRNVVEKNYHIRIIFDETIRHTSRDEVATRDLVFYLRRDLLMQHAGPHVNIENIPAFVPVRITAETLNIMAERFYKINSRSKAK